MNRIKFFLRYAKGFTMVEALVSIIILGVMIAMLLPSIFMAMKLYTDTKENMWATYENQYYNELAKAYALNSSLIKNQSYHSALGDNIKVRYEKVPVGNDGAYVLKQIIDGNGYSFSTYVANVHQKFTTVGVYISIINPHDGEKISGSSFIVTVKSFFVQDGATDTVDNVEVTFDGNICSPQTSDPQNSLYTFSCMVNGQEGLIPLIAKATKDYNGETIEDEYKINVLVNPVNDIYISWLQPVDGEHVSQGTSTNFWVQAVTNLGGDVDSVDFYVNGTLHLQGALSSNHKWVSSAYTFSDAGTYVLKAVAHYGNLTKEESITIYVDPYVFKIVDVVENLGDNDFQMPDYIKRTDKYVVIEYSVPFSGIHLQVSDDENTYNFDCAVNIVENGKPVCYVDISSIDKSHWCPYEVIHLHAYWDTTGLTDDKNVSVYPYGQWVISKQEHYEYDITQLRTIDTGTVMLSIYLSPQKTVWSPYNVCGTSLDITQIISDLIGNTTSTITNFSMYKASYNEREGYVYEASYQKTGIWWFAYYSLVDEYARNHTLIDNNYYVLKHLTITDTSNSSTVGDSDFSFDSSGVGKVSFENINQTLNNLQFDLQLWDNENRLPYCTWHEDGSQYYVASEYDVPVRIKVDYYDDQYHTDIYPIAFCRDDIAYMRDSIQLTINKTMLWYAMSNDNCFNNYQYSIVGKIYLANIAAYSLWDYKILLLHDNYNDSFEARIYDNNCNYIKTINLTSSGTEQYKMETISMSDLPNLNTDKTIYYWIEYNPKQPISGSINPVMTATYTISEP